jgi:hypothetical protein
VDAPDQEDESLDSAGEAAVLDRLKGLGYLE